MRQNDLRPDDKSTKASFDERTTRMSTNNSFSEANLPAYPSSFLNTITKPIGKGYTIREEDHHSQLLLSENDLKEAESPSLPFDMSTIDKRIRKWSLFFSNKDDQELYREYVRDETIHQRLTYERERVWSMILSLSLILLGCVYEVYIIETDRISSPIRIELPDPQSQPNFFGIYMALACFPLQFLSCWLPAPRSPALGWLRYLTHLNSSFGIFFGVLLSRLGKLWLCPQAIMQLLLVYLANLDFDFLQPEMPFYALFVILIALAVLPSAALTFISSAHISDQLQILSVTAIVLATKHQHTYSKRSAFLINVSENKSRELQRKEATFFISLSHAILPRRTLESLLSSPTVQSSSTLEYFEAITVLYLDITSFTVLSSSLTPQNVMAILNLLFTKFDSICIANDVEKILTIGDAYIMMSIPKKEEAGQKVTGEDAFELSQEQTFSLKSPIHHFQTSTMFGRTSSFVSVSSQKDAETKSAKSVNLNVAPSLESLAVAASKACLAALAMQKAVSETCKEIEGGALHILDEDGKMLVSKLQARIGIFTGKAFGCITGGIHKIKYELIGEAVEEAEKIEQLAAPGTVCCSKRTALLVVGISEAEERALTSSMYALRFERNGDKNDEIWRVGVLQ
ncbi:hypothetical protein HDU97_000757 [Phlyctochytrium planicorne]|nr:hypothetical protein HDU97_000757 [Phlyctochytrium planicorne]